MGAPKRRPDQVYHFGNPAVNLAASEIHVEPPSPPFPPRVSVSRGAERGSERLTEEDDDAEQDGDDGAGAQAGCHDVLLVGAVPVDVTLADFDSQVGGVGHGQVARVGDDDGDLVDAAFEEADLEAQLGVVAWRRREGEQRDKEHEFNSNK